MQLRPLHLKSSGKVTSSAKPVLSDNVYRFGCRRCIELRRAFVWPNYECADGTIKRVHKMVDSHERETRQISLVILLVATLLFIGVYIWAGARS